MYAEKRKLYHTPMLAPNASRREKQQASKDLDPVMNDLINRKSANFSCSRQPPNVLFENEKAAQSESLSCVVTAKHSLIFRSHAASDHKQCRPDLPDGCPRCRPGIPDPCCEDCHPDAFADFALVPPRPKPSKPKLHRVSTKYEKGRADFALRDALLVFRREQTIKSFGISALKSLGPGLVLPDQLLDRIVDCAHHGYITSAQSLLEYTRWDGSHEYASDVLALIDAHRTSTTVQPGSESAPTSRTTPSLSTKPVTCGACKQGGHTGAYWHQVLVAPDTDSSSRHTLARSRSCPLFHLRTGQKENALQGGPGYARRCSKCGEIGHQGE